VSPILIGQRFEPTGLSLGAADIVDENVEASPLSLNLINDGLNAGNVTDVGGDEQRGARFVGDVRPVVATRAPPSWKRRISAAPMPLVPPVMRTRLPVNSSDCTLKSYVMVVVPSTEKVD
jgi:hypothetical protein